MSSRLEDMLVRERHQLVLWAPVALGAGIAAYFILPHVGQWQAVAAAGAALALIGCAIPGLFGRCVLWFGLLFTLGLGGAWIRSETMGATRLREAMFAREFVATVAEVREEPARDRYRLLLDPVDLDLPELVRVSLRKAPGDHIAPGATVRLRATLRPPPGPSFPGGYDFAQRAWFERVGAVGYALGDVHLVESAPPPSGLAAKLQAVRRYLTQRIRREVGGQAGGIAAALVTGDRGGIPDEVTEDMRDSGLAHLLSISGMHIAVVVGGTMWLVRRLLLLSMWMALRWPVKTIAAGVAALAGIAYTLLAGAEVPTVRSCIATLIVLVGLSLGRQAISLRMVAAAAFLILLVRPEALLGPSFQLSFAAVTCIVVFYQSPLGRRLLAGGEASLLSRLGRSLAALVLTGILVEAALAPIAMAHFGRTGFYGVLANVIAIPFSSFVIMPAAVAALLLDPVGLAAPAYAVLRWSLDFLILLSASVASWPGAVARMPSMPAWAFAGFVCGGLWLCLWQGRTRWLGFAPVAVAALAALLAMPADLIVGHDGRNVGLVSKQGELAMLRVRSGSFVSDMWSDAVAADQIVGWGDTSTGRCSRDTCSATIEQGARRWRILATRSRALVDRRSLAPACQQADIVVSDRRLPDWCRPRWLKLDRAQLARTGSVAIRFNPLRVDTVADRHGDHPWATAGADQWYRRSRPTSLP